MSRFGKILLASLGTVVFASNAIPAWAQRTVSTETTIETRGVGFRGANVFNPKYKERIGTYAEQIEMGKNKGWLTAAEVDEFTRRLEGMKEQEAAAAAKGWQKADVDAIDKVFTQYNIDLTKAANKPAPKATPAATPGSSSTPNATPVATPSSSTAKPAGTVAGGAPKSTTRTTATKTTAKKTQAKKAPSKKPATK